MRRHLARKIVELSDTLDGVSTPGTAKNLYDAYSVSREKDAELEDALTSLCSKIAMGLAMPKAPTPPKVPGPRLNKPGATASVGRFMEAKGTVGRAPTPVGAKGVDTTRAGVVNPRAPLSGAMTAATAMKTPR